MKLGAGTYTGLTVTDVVSGGGHASDTVVSALLQSDQLNRQVYLLGNVSGACLTVCTVEFSYYIRAPSTLGCYRSISNGVYVDQAGVTGHLAVASDNFSVNCN